MMLMNVTEGRSRTLAIIEFEGLIGRRIEGKKNGFQGGDLKSKRLSNDCSKHSARACILKGNSAIILSSLPMKGRGLGGLLHGRIIAASRFCRGVFHFGLDDSCVVLSRTGALRGKPSGLLIPVYQSANLRGVAHQLGGCVVGFKNRKHGECAMSATQSKALSPELVQAFFERRLSSDVSPELIARIKAASNAVYAVAYKAIDAASSCPEIKKAGSTPEDFRDFLSGVVRAVVSAKTAYDWDNASGDKGVDHE